MFIWRTLAVVAFAICIFICIILRKKKYLKNNYTFAQEADILINTIEMKKKDRNLIFEPTNEKTKTYINKYILSRIKNTKTVICEYANIYNKISFYITVFDKYGRIISVLKINDTRKVKISKIVTLPLRCASINIAIRSINNEILSSIFINPSKKTIFKFSSLISIMLLCGIIALRQLYLEITASFYIVEYFNNNNLLDLLVFLTLSFLCFVIFELLLLIKYGWFKRGSGIENVDI